MIVDAGKKSEVAEVVLAFVIPTKTGARICGGCFVAWLPRQDYRTK